MALTVVLDPQADADIEDEFNYLADRSLDAGLRFLSAADNTFAALAEMPGMGRYPRFKDPRLAGLRMWPIKGFSNYLIFYLTTEENIRVLRILHGARNIEQILSDTEL
jgi:toxin ParE1/3/4